MQAAFFKIKNKVKNVFGVFILYIISTFLLNLRYRTWKDGENKLN